MLNRERLESGQKQNASGLCARFLRQSEINITPRYRGSVKHLSGRILRPPIGTLCARKQLVVLIWYGGCFKGGVCWEMGQSVEVNGKIRSIDSETSILAPSSPVRNLSVTRESSTSCRR